MPIPMTSALIAFRVSNVLTLTFGLRWCALNLMLLPVYLRVNLKSFSGKQLATSVVGCFSSFMQ